jgi:hypothetical protein
VKRLLLAIPFLIASCGEPCFADERGIDRTREATDYIGTPTNLSYCLIQDSSSTVAKRIKCRDLVTRLQSDLPDGAQAECSDLTAICALTTTAFGIGALESADAAAFRTYIGAGTGSGTGDVVGPASSTDHAIARFDLTTGKLLQNSVGILTDAGALSGITDLAMSGAGTGVAKLAPWASNDSWYALGLSGVVGASTYNLRSHPSTPHLEINVPSGYEIRFRTADTIRAVLDASAFFPSGPVSLGKLGTGFDGLFLDSSSTTNTIKIAGGAAGSNITLTTPTSTGTLALTSDVVTDHGALSGLADDDHTQYHTDARGDARYSLLGHDHNADYQPLDADLTSWAGVTRASGFDDWVADPTSAKLRTLVSDESGTGALLFANGNIGAATGTSLQLSGGGSVGADNRWYYGGVATGWNLRQNLSGNLVWADALTNELTLSTAALFPSTSAGLDLGLTGTRWGAGYFSGLVRASSLNLTLGGTELALGTGEVAMFTNRAAAADDAFLGVNAGSGGDAGFRTYHDGTESFRINSTTGGFGIAPNITTDPSAEFIGVAGASGFWRFRDGSATALLNLDFATNIATMLRYNVASTPTALSNGANSNITLPATGFMYVTGPTGAFNITGIVPPSDNADGYVLRIFNSTTQNMTLTNDATSTAANRILTLTGADVAGAGVQMATLIYSTGQSRWLLAATQG